MPYADLTPEELDRFWAKVDQSEGVLGCWPWTGGKHPRGYGLFSSRRKGSSRTWRAHRLMYERVYGIEPGILLVLHRCDNPCCCNPSHLFLGTHQDNMDDKTAKGRQSRGEDRPRAKLTEDLVREIRAAKERGEPLLPYAKRLGITHHAVYLAAHRKTWKHVD